MPSISVRSSNDKPWGLPTSTTPPQSTRSSFNNGSTSTPPLSPTSKRRPATVSKPLNHLGTNLSEKTMTRSRSGTNMYIKELHDLQPLPRSRSFSDSFTTAAEPVGESLPDKRFTKVDLKQRFKRTNSQSNEETLLKDLARANFPIKKGASKIHSSSRS